MRIIGGILALLLFAGAAQAQNCTVPNTFINGTIIDAGQVNANFAALTNCATVAPHVGTTAALAASPSTAFPNGVWRDDYSAGLGAPPLFYINSGTACSQPDNGAQITSSDAKCWVARFIANTLDVREWGAQAGSDATAPLKAALAACTGGARVLVPITLTVNSAITIPGTSTNCELTGNGRYGISQINPGSSFPSGTNMFTFIGPGGTPSASPVNGTNSFAIRNLSINCSGAPSMDSYALDIESTSAVILDSIFMYKCPKGVSLVNDGNVYVNNWTQLDLAANTGVGFQINIIGDFRAQNFYYDSDNPGGYNTDASVYFNFVAGADMVIDNGSILHVRSGVVVAPQGSTSINAFVIGNGVYIDQTSNVAVIVQPATAANNVTLGIIGGHLWTAVEGILINTNGGGIGDIRITADLYNHLKNAIDIEGAPTLVSLDAVRANGYGCQTTGTANTTTSGNQVTLLSQTGCGLNTTWGNQPITINSVSYTIGTVIDSTHFTLTTNPGNQSGVAYNFAPAVSGGAGVLIGASVPQLFVRNSQLGPGGFVGTSRGWGIFNQNASITMSIQNSDLRSNSVAGINTVACGGGCRFEGTPGLNPIGATVGQTVGASPATVCAGPAWETHYFLQSATNTATVSISGTVFGTISSATLPLVVTLGPGECEVVTWATTAPTYNKMVH